MGGIARLCLISLLLLGVVGSPLSRQQRTLLRQLHGRILRLSTDKKDMHHFEHQTSHRERLQWQQLQNSPNLSKATTADLAFALAYYGIDYDRNLRRVLKPYTVWRQVYTNYRPGTADDIKDYTGLTDAVEAVPGRLAILFAKRRDSKSIRYLLDMQTDGAVAEAHTSAISQLWNDGHELALLRAACTSKTPLDNLAQVLEVEDIRTDEHPKKALRLERALLARYSRRADPCISYAAKRVSALLVERMRYSGFP
jgi:hypothetical protein